MASSNNINPSVNKMQQEVNKGQAPRTVRRVDQASLNIGDSRAHVHFTDGSALKDDGTWKHGGRKLSREEKQWLQKHGWKIPVET
ncbi:unnamed protein product [Rotaria sp. Silwood1]|nr:unnamed protein product [Rotaria sp. Silwood1]CAF1425097.1 unnamed protein product [Rotaria sp. Silwood1]CAF1457245.1 unnamed protein product [Rotaria sp. Silwood1]CAF3546690.1 unnamed protein product [Rotaria sp. Silwood1]CAF3605905.1 unnamed protein product [Rotaria sp. Silwood1]